MPQTPHHQTNLFSSTDQSLRKAVNSFNELEEGDSELFNAELEKFIEDEKNQNQKLS